MAWTSVLDWTTAQVVTAAQMDTYVSDNTKYLKDILDGAQEQTVILRRAYTTGGNPSNLELRAHLGSLASPATVDFDDSLGDIWFKSWDGDSYETGALIRARAAALPAAGRISTYLSFYTNTNVAGELFERFRITQGGQVFVSDGSASAPGISFLGAAGAANFGMYRGPSSTVSFAVTGTEQVRITGSGVEARAATNVGYGWIGDDCGLFYQSADYMTINLAGAARIGISQGLAIYSNAAGPSFWTNDVAVGIKAPSKIPLFVERTGDDGTLISLVQAGTEEGTISVSGATISYNTFIGAHYTQLQEGQEEPPRFGVVVATGKSVPSERWVWRDEDGNAHSAGMAAPDPAWRKEVSVSSERFTYVAGTHRQGDPKVYGVWLGMVSQDARGKGFGRDGAPVYNVAGLGLASALVVDTGDGDLEPGDLLETSTMPYHAKKQSDGVIRSSTLGKVVVGVKWEDVQRGTRNWKTAVVGVVLYCG